MARPRRPTQGLPRLEHPPGLLTQVEHLLRQAIADGYFASGRLPPLAELAEQLGVSRETVRLACARLQQEGLIRKNTATRHFPRTGLLAQTTDSEQGTGALLFASGLRGLAFV
jgi:DNA-binding FadR family transcriptional regulator